MNEQEIRADERARILKAIEIYAIGRRFKGELLKEKYALQVRDHVKSGGKPKTKSGGGRVQLQPAHERAGVNAAA